MTEAKGSEVVLLAGAKGSEVVLVEAKGSEVPANGSTSVSYEGGGSAGGPAVWLQGSAMPGGGGGYDIYQYFRAVLFLWFCIQLILNVAINDIPYSRNPRKYHMH